MMFSFSQESKQASRLESVRKPFALSEEKEEETEGGSQFYHFGLTVMWYNNTDFNEVFRSALALMLSRSYGFHHRKVGNARNSDASAITYTSIALKIMRKYRKFHLMPWKAKALREENSFFDQRKLFEKFTSAFQFQFDETSERRFFSIAFRGLSNDKLIIKHDSDRLAAKE